MIFDNEQNENDNEYIICFIIADEKNNLDLYPFYTKTKKITQENIFKLYFFT